MSNKEPNFSQSVAAGGPKVFSAPPRRNTRPFRVSRNNAIKKGSVSSPTYSNVNFLRTAVSLGSHVFPNIKRHNLRTLSKRNANFHSQEFFNTYTPEFVENANQYDKYGRTLLYSSIKSNTPKGDAIAKMLIQRKEVNLDKGCKEINNNGIVRLIESPIFAAIENNKYDIVKLLIEKGANINYVRTSNFGGEKNNFTPLCCMLDTIIQIRNFDNADNHVTTEINLIKLLLQKGADINHKVIIQEDTKNVTEYVINKHPIHMLIEIMKYDDHKQFEELFKFMILRNNIDLYVFYKNNYIPEDNSNNGNFTNNNNNNGSLSNNSIKSNTQKPELMNILQFIKHSLPNDYEEYVQFIIDEKGFKTRLDTEYNIERFGYFDYLDDLRDYTREPINPNIHHTINIQGGGKRKSTRKLKKYSKRTRSK
jgi:hypothetical protein